MGKIRHPTTFSEHFRLPSSKLAELGVTNVTLAVDTRLFFDPLLIENCSNPRFAVSAAAQYRDHFESVIKVLAASKSPGDVAWRAAEAMFQFHEIRGTCLGYGAGSIDGSAWGPDLIAQVLTTAKEIVDLGLNDPDIFPLLGLFEDGVGPDRISDITTNVTIDAILAFNDEIIQALNLPVEEFDLNGRTALLVRNPYHPKRTPVVLTPRDVLRPLPTASDWDEVARAAAHNDRLRKKVNAHVGHLWAKQTYRNRAELRTQALGSAEAFSTLLDAAKATKRRPYDLALDEAGLLRWAPDGQSIAQQFPLQLQKPEHLDLEAVYRIVRTIVDQFKQLVEQNGLAKSLWARGKALPEKYAQRLFFAVAYSYCKQNNLDISPEVDSGNGQVDFKFSSGFHQRVLVEIKLSRNGKLVEGYTRQLEAYKAAEETMRAVYLVVDVGKMGEKDEQLLKIREEATAKAEPVSDLDFVDGHIKRPASKR